MEFKIYEKYLAQNEEHAHKSSELNRKKDEAKAELDSLLAEYEALMVEMIGGKDVAKKLDELDKKIVTARKESERAEQALELFYRLPSAGTITRDDIVAEFNGNFAPKYYETDIKPALDAVEAAKTAYLDAVRNYYRKSRKINEFREEMAGTLGYDFPHAFHVKDIYTRADHDKYFVREDDFEKARFDR